MKNISEFKLMTKWLKNTICRYKHKNQRKEDLSLIMNGFKGFASGIHSLCKILYNTLFMLVFPNMHKSESIKALPALKKALSGMCIIIVSPVLVIRVVLRLFFTLMSERSNSVFLNKGLNKIINEYNNQKVLTQPDIFAETLTRLEAKSQKYTSNEQKDSNELNTILKTPQLLAYQKIDAIKLKIKEKEEEANQRDDNDYAADAVWIVNHH
jgi:hypothetical protein